MKAAEIFGWLVLAFPLVGSVVCGLLYKTVPAKTTGYIGSFAILGSGLDALDTHGAHVGAGFGSPGQIGQLLLQRFLIPFEAASFLLLVAAVGAVVLARRQRGLVDTDDELPEGGPPTKPGWLREPDQRPPAERAGATRPAAGTAEGPGDPAPQGGSA